MLIIMNKKKDCLKEIIVMKHNIMMNNIIKNYLIYIKII